MNSQRKKRNNSRPILFSYEIEKVKQRNRKNIAEEYLTFLGILYQDQIESGNKRISDYGTMTLADIQTELHLRTKIISADIMRKVRKQKEEQERKEKQLLEHFKKSG